MQQMMSGRSVGESSRGECERNVRQGFFNPEPTPTLNFGAGDPSDSQPSRLARQVITLAFLPYDRPSRTLSECLAQSLCSETSSSVILVRFTSPQQQNPRDYLNGEFH